MWLWATPRQRSTVPRGFSLPDMTLYVPKYSDLSLVPRHVRYVADVQVRKRATPAGLYGFSVWRSLEESGRKDQEEREVAGRGRAVRGALAEPALPVDAWTFYRNPYGTVIARAFGCHLILPEMEKPPRRTDTLLTS